MLKRYYAIRQVFYYLILTIILYSCISQKKIKYVQETPKKDTISTLKITKGTSNTIQPYDELFIRVIGFEEETYKFFNFEMNQGGINNQNMSLFGYMVNDSGYIDFPVIGKVFLKDNSIDQAKIILKNKLKEYVNEVDVVIKFINRTITVLGEVRAPGRHQTGKEQLTILEALGLAGDLTDYANRKKITIIRESDGEVNYFYVDVTEKNIVSSELYYIKPNDIIYAEPLKAKSMGIRPGATETLLPYLSFITSVISIYLLIKSL